MKSLTILIALAGLLGSTAASADTDCTDPIGQWQSRDALRQAIERNGWVVQRIKIDDGCYEVRAVDRGGNRVKAKYSPATLKIRSFAVEFGPDADTSEYIVPGGRKPPVATKRN